MTTKGFATFDRRIATRANRRKARAGLVFAAQQLENELIDVLSVPPKRTGRKYKRGDKTHTASRAGEAPAPDKGELRQSMVNYLQESPGTGLQAIVGSPLPRAATLHLGSENIDPRPWLDLPFKDPAAMNRVMRAFRVGAKRVK